ncbi:hypothetical protein OPT61_g10304 [Boeremia exigua]|uniref:Uncharacterized protein n=1 Tax=Boeremia exigua TaxID=749465 RepID=A0ACC2HQ95_9PLEO|nr:hypothetical protein OPT61_g10304 [Boeremia exigua]
MDCHYDPRPSPADGTVLEPPARLHVQGLQKRVRMGAGDPDYECRCGGSGHHGHLVDCSAGCGRLYPAETSRPAVECVVQYPLFQILTSWDEFSVPHCLSTRFITDRSYWNSDCDMRDKGWDGYTRVGTDLEPAQLAVMSVFSVIPVINSQLPKLRDTTRLRYLWQEKDGSGDRWPADLANIDKPGFVAALPVDTTTGVLREHIMRMNSSISCTELSSSDFPSTCSGTDPFQASFNYNDPYYERNGTLDDVSEEIFFRFKEIPIPTERFPMGRYTDTVEGAVHCTAQTTRGYFELGNKQNKDTYGPLLDKWSSVGPQHQSHDYFQPEYNSSSAISEYFPSEEDHDIGFARSIADPPLVSASDSYTNVTGPLMTSVLALFGPTSWMHSVRNVTGSMSEDELAASQATFLELLCGSSPFHDSSSMCRVNYASLKSAADSFLDGWTGETSTTETRLRTAMFVANRATLTSQTEGPSPWVRNTGRNIWTAEGFTLIKPSISLPAQIILSIIVAMHILGLLYLARRPSPGTARR